MGAAADQTVWFYPELARDLEEVRKGVLLKAERDSERIYLLTALGAPEIAILANNSAEPFNLLCLFKEISLSWIVLPRAYELLEKQHCRCLPYYLRYMLKEKNPRFLKVISRILIEFFGNFAKKFMDEDIDSQRAADILFYGYSTLFWKNLRDPPHGFEDIALFDIYLNWTQAFWKRFDAGREDMEKMIGCMSDVKRKLFLRPGNNTGPEVSNDPSWLQVVLRHGQLGIGAAVEYLLPVHSDGTLKTHRYSIRDLPGKIWPLLRTLKEQYPAESYRTRESTRKFLIILKHRCLDPDAVTLNQETAQERFIRFRTAALIQDVLKSISRSEADHSRRPPS
ncbi:MAG: hypothetical protein JRH18_09015 [Deltaproteobacteria bacterium]|nr:hypothetical protein [Deltaproteobacteria bacterium]MBW1961347.1 hypothetical protein [Deltaproteobacteria bacterium]MBW2151794.1 hypothetical protein [Deltaproteobacteria bacterium]